MLSAPLNSEKTQMPSPLLTSLPGPSHTAPNPQDGFLSPVLRDTQLRPITALLTSCSLPQSQLIQQTLCARYHKSPWEGKEGLSPQKIRRLATDLNMLTELDQGSWLAWPSVAEPALV